MYTPAKSKKKKITLAAADAPPGLDAVRNAAGGSLCSLLDPGLAAVLPKLAPDALRGIRTCDDDRGALIDSIGVARLAPDRLSGSHALYDVPFLGDEACSALMEDMRAHVARGGSPDYDCAEMGLAATMHDLATGAVVPLAAAVGLLAASDDAAGSGSDDGSATASDQWRTHGFCIWHEAGEDAPYSLWTYPHDNGDGTSELTNEHTDSSLVTLNFCLGASEDLGGSEVVFYGAPTPPGLPRNPNRPSHRHAAVAGRGVLHAGENSHDVLPIRTGWRANLILWISPR